MALSSITFLGHSAFLLKTQHEIASYSIAIDPWLSDNPSCPEPCKNIDQLDAIILSHGHYDHAADAVKLAVKHQAPVIAVYELGNLLIEDGVPSELVMHSGKGGAIELFGLTISLTNAFHSNSYNLKSETRYAGEACGIIVSDGTTAIYHAGDTCLFSDMLLIGELYQPRFALLPIGGRFTMDPRAAARAAKMLGSEILIPMHYGTFPPLTGSPEEFQIWCNREKVDGAVMPLNPGETLSVSSLSR